MYQFKKVEEKPINIQELYDKGFTKEFILTAFGVEKESDIVAPDVKEWFEGKNEKNVFFIQPTSTIFESRDYSDEITNRIPTCK